MSRRFEEIDRRPTPMGEISVRRRLEPTLDVDIYEVKLGDEFLMTSLFTAAEIALAHLGLAETSGEDLDVVVGGLGLGYTAVAALEDDRVRNLHVVEAIDAVIDWHRDELLPLSTVLVADDRCTFVNGDFFALVRSGEPFGRTAPDRAHAVLLDIDHTPGHVLHGSHADFYEAPGLRRIVDRIHPGGVFAMWSDDPPDDGFMAVLADVFASARAEVVSFPNPLTGGSATNTVYLARCPA